MEDNAIDFYNIVFFFLFIAGCCIFPGMVILSFNYLPAAEFLDCLQLRASTKKAVTNSPVQVSV